MIKKRLIVLKAILAITLTNSNSTAYSDYTVCDKNCPIDDDNCSHCWVEDCSNIFCCKIGDGGYRYETGNPIK